jgi:hypothetical protein
VDWIHLAQDGDQCRCCYEHGSKPLGSIEGKKFLDYIAECIIIFSVALISQLNYQKSSKSDS